MKDFYEFLHDIKNKYSIYIGGTSVQEVHAFIQGYFYAKKELGIEATDQEKDFQYFHAWLQERLLAKTNLSWAKILQFRSSNDRKAAELFFELVEEFAKRDQNLDTDNKS